METQNPSEGAAAAAIAEQEHGQPQTDAGATTSPAAETSQAQPDPAGSSQEKPAEDPEPPTGENAPTLPTPEEIQAARDKLDASDDAFNRRIAEKQIELDRLQAECAQSLRVRANVNSHRLGMVIRRANGDYQAEQIGHRAMKDIELQPGDQLLIAPLGADSLRDFLRMADMAPAAGQPEGDVAASPGGTA